MYEVVTDHQVVAFGPDRMDLFDCQTGVAIASAVRADGVWTVHADGTADVSAASRTDAAVALTEKAIEVLDGTGYSTTVPHGLLDAP